MDKTSGGNVNPRGWESFSSVWMSSRGSWSFIFGKEMTGKVYFSLDHRFHQNFIDKDF